MFYDLFLLANYNVEIEREVIIEYKHRLSLIIQSEMRFGGVESHIASLDRKLRLVRWFVSLSMRGAV